MNSHSNRSALLRFAAAILVPCAAAVAWSAAQGPAPAAPGRAVVVIDPAHGGPDAGAKLGDQVQEKDVTLAMAERLRAGLAGAGFTVVLTRDGEVANGLTTDQRAEIANRQHALACLVIHATETGSGVHLYISGLQPDADPEAGGRVGFHPVPWDRAQAGSVRQSLALEDELDTAAEAAKIGALQGRAEVRPLNSLECPAVALEMAPLRVAGGDRTAVTDADYQKRVVDVVVAALKKWRMESAEASQAAEPVRRRAETGAGQ